MTPIILPELGEGIAQATIACWHVALGDSVREGQEICEAVSDKASFVIEAPVAGRLQSMRVIAGQEALIGAVLGIIE